MAQIVRTRQARQDVLEIWERIASNNPTAADGLIRRFDDVIRLLSDQPQIGVSQAKYRPGLRCMAVSRYLIFYDQIPQGIRILRILHGARNWEDLIS